MKSPSLSVGAFGDQVADLHDKLLKHGFQIPSSEVKRKFFGPATHAAVREWQKKYSLKPIGAVDEETKAALEAALDLRKRNPGHSAANPNPAATAAPTKVDPPAETSADPKPEEKKFVVRGHIKYKGGKLSEGLIVRVYNKDLRNEDILGEAKTDQEGRYDITYDRKQFSRPEKESADLIVRVYDPSGADGNGDKPKDRLLGESPVIFSAQPVEKVSLSVDGGPDRTWSEYEQMMAELTTVLGDTPITTLDEDENQKDITFLAGQAKLSARRIAYLVIAHKLATKTRMQPEIFYGFARQGLPTTLPELLAQSRDVQRKALESAIKTGIIPGRLVDSLDQILQALNEQVVKQALEQPRDENKTSLGALLGTTLQDVEKQSQFLTAYVNHKGPIEEFWKGLRTQPEFKEKVQDLQVTLQIGALTANHLPVAQQLQQMRKAGELKSVRDLARFEVSDWQDIIGKSANGGVKAFPPEVAGENDEEKLHNYASTMAHMIEDAFPTETIAHRIQKDQSAERADMRVFFQNVLKTDTGFELSRIGIDKHLAKNPTLLDGVTDKNKIISQLKGAQRISRFAPRVDAMLPLIKNGVDSALAVTRMGESAFTAQFVNELGVGETKRVYMRADHVVATALNLFANFNASINGTSMAVLPWEQPTVEGIPDWETLFGSLDLCACKHCRSVHSPAAYLVELLAFLKERKSKDAYISVKDVLFQRRPDIGEIELTCENTNTPLPYVDLVNEVMENAIVPFRQFNLPAGLETDLMQRIFSEALRKAFEGQGLRLKPDSVVVESKSGSKWFVTDHNELYSINKEQASGQFQVISRSYQTSGSPQELRANSQHVNSAAYEILRKTFYPWSTPFDLWVEKGRTYLEHLGISREELMRTFQTGGQTADPSDIEIATEFLGMTATERQIITVTLKPPLKPWEFWGLSETDNDVKDLEDPRLTVKANWLDVLMRIRQLFDRSGLNYEEVIELLKTKFVNPNDPTIHIEAIKQERDSATNKITSVDPTTCDTNKLIITPLDAFAVDRIHRFVRLWRKLGWTMAELDKAITALQAPDVDLNLRINDELVLKLSHIRRLQGEFRLPIDRILTLWSNIDVDGDDPLYDRLFQNSAVLKPVDPAFSLSGKELEIVTTDPAGATITKHTATILAALGVSANDLAAIRTDADLDDKPGPPQEFAPLNLANLSKLYRVTVLAKGLRLSINDVLTFKAVTGINPFNSSQTESTLRFLRVIEKIRASKFSSAELSYLLRHQYSETSAIAPSDEGYAAILDDIRTNLWKIGDDTALVADPTGDATRKKLALLKWDTALIEAAIATLNGNAIYEVPLDSLPDEFAFPDAVKNKIYYDKNGKKLAFGGSMTESEETGLLAAFSDVAYQTAVRRLADAPRKFVSEKMKVFELPTFSASLEGLPLGLTFPARLKNRIYFDARAKELRFVGFMPDEDHVELLDLSTDVPFRSAIDSLFVAPQALAPEPDNIFLTPADAAGLFDSPIPSEQRFEIVLTKLLPHLKKVLSVNLVKQKLGEALRLDGRTTEQLITSMVKSPVNPSWKCIDEFLVQTFAQSSPAIPVTRVAFPNQFMTLTLLHKIAMVVSKLKITSTQLLWLQAYGPQVGWPDINTLPLIPNASAIKFDSWEKLFDLCQLQTQLPAGGTVLTEVFALANDTTTTLDVLIDRLSKLTNWNVNDIQELSDRLQIWTGTQYLSLAQPMAYLHESAIMRLRACFAIMKRLGASAKHCLEWVNADLTDADANNIMQTAKAKYEDDQWLSVAKPLQDALREKQRESLVGYLLAHPDPDPNKEQNWRSANELYDYFLIDVEMDPCMITSRVKQAIGSTQLFIQRCLMNLERHVKADEAQDIHWREWKWMKNYRVWEANRKVFLYPENWIEPELRDDKTQFFKDLENALLQNDVTLEIAEDAFLNYLEKLDAVARLEIIGMYHQVETDMQGQTVIDILHVFGRTRGTAHTYYYRQRVDSARWTPWEKVDLDIEGDHLIPVIWNRRLYLFWPLFVEKAEQPPDSAPLTEKSQPVSEPIRFWEIQMAWSEYKRKKWLPKQVTTSKLRSNASPVPSDRDTSRLQHVFRAVPDPTGGLSIFCEYTYSVVLPARPPYYSNATRIKRGGGLFYFAGCGGDVKVAPGTMGPTIPLPRGVTTFGMMYKETEGGLYLPKNLATASYDLAAANTPGSTPFTVLYAHQDFYLTGLRPLFFQDDTMTFFIIPEEVTVNRSWWKDTNLVRPELIDLSRSKYYLQPQAVNRLRPQSLASNLVIHESAPSADTISRLRETVAMRNNPNPSKVAMSAVKTMRADLAVVRNTNMTTTKAATFRWLQDSITANRGASLLAARNIRAIVKENWLHPAPTIATSWKERRYQFQIFFHPYLCLFISRLNHEGIDGLVDRTTQLQSSSPVPLFKNRYEPTDLIVKGDPSKEDLYPREDVDFSYGGAYAQYNWEIFFHAPLLIANRLGQNQRFEEAQKWFHYIFNPTDTSADEVPQKYWRSRPFYETTQADYRRQKIETLIKKLAADEPEPELEKQVGEWRTHPFNPHLIARLRNTSYQKTVVMKYLDNLIAWGDQLFRRDTIESINEATQLYVMAAEILGRRPVIIPPRGEATVQTFNSLDPRLDDFSDRLVETEHLVPTPSLDMIVSPTEKPPLPLPTTVLYFSVMQNEKLLGYWDTVADRLFKIRHCMSIEGIVRELPLFEPPIDPGLLVRAFAAGIDISSALNDINAALPHYRFNVMVQKAAELCAEVKSLGQALLSALEKRDAESLALLRSSHEINLLSKVREVKVKQIDEATITWEGLKNGKKVTETRRDYYRDIIRINENEQLHLDKLEAAYTFQMIGQGIELLVAGLALIPDFDTGVSGAFGSPVLKLKIGGTNFSAAVQAASRVMNFLSQIQSHEANRASIMGGFDRRWDDWKQQEKLANLELAQIDKQIEATDIRKQIADQELQNHDIQVENAKEVDTFMRDKFTNRDLYDWMVGQISSLYFQSYQMAYDTAKRAERAYRYELGLDDSNFIQFGYWDSLKKGLLAGERLHQDIKRLELAYLDQNKREYEITKHISLSMLDPIALMKLRETGECFVNLPESLFDLDYPGHYMRRIKSVSLTIPCVTGPYTGVNCTLTLLRNSLRRVSTLRAGNYSRDMDIDDPRFRDTVGAIQSIATSHAQNDSGVFELNFRDERYLPFEGAGVISSWRIELTKDFMQIDPDTISEVVIHLKYTAREGGEALKQPVVTELQGAINRMLMAENRKGLSRFFSLKHDFPTEWYRFLNTADASSGDHVQGFAVTQDRFPFYMRAKDIKISKISVVALPKDGPLAPFNVYVTPSGSKPSETSDKIELEADTTLRGLLYKEKSFPAGQERVPGAAWTLKIKGEDFLSLTNALDDIGVFFHYSVEERL